MSKNQKETNGLPQGENNSKALIVGLDDGHSAIKIYTHPDPTNPLMQPIKFKMLSRGAAGIKNMGADDIINDQLVVVGDRVFTVLESLTDFEDTRNDDYQTSKLSKALVYQALRGAHLPNKRLIISCGLPVNKFYVDQRPNKQLITEKKLNLLNMDDVYNKYDHAHGIPRIEIENNKVLCEANAAFYDVLMDDAGEPTQIGLDYELMEYGAAVLDIGGRTTDCVVVNPNGGSLNAKRSGTLNLGILDFQEAIRTKLKSVHKFGHISEIGLSKALLTGKYGPTANQVDISDIIEAEKQTLFNGLETFIKSTIGDTSDVPALILVGGGAYVLKDILSKKYNNLIIPDEMEFSNARGFFKILSYVLGTK